MSGNDRPQKPAFDLEERTAVFGEAVIRFAKTIPKNSITLPLISQPVRAGTSVGANYCEADDAVSKKDFKNQIGTCRKEARETKLWFRMISTAEPELKIEARKLWQKPRNCISCLLPFGESHENANSLLLVLGHSFVIRI